MREEKKVERNCDERRRKVGRGASGGEKQSDEWKVVSYVRRRYVRGAKRAQGRKALPQ